MEDSIAPRAAPPPTPFVAAAPVLTRRRAHLDSACYRALSRLFSHCLQVHPSHRESPTPPAVDLAAAKSVGGDSGEPPEAPRGAGFNRPKDAEEAAASGSPPRQETLSPAIVEAAAANPIEAPQRSVEDVQETALVESTCCKTSALGEELGVGAGLVAEDETFQSVMACLEGEVNESVEATVDNDNDQMLLDAMMTNFSGLIDDADAGAMPTQSCGISGGELQNSDISEDVNELGGGIEDDKPVGSSDHKQLNGDGFEEGEIEGEAQDLDTEESGGSELGEEDAEDEKLEIKGNVDHILNKDANVRGDAHSFITRAQAVSYDEVLDWNETPLPDDEAPNPGKKRKRALTEKRKAQKTKNKRKKRAEQRKAEGVNRLKLPSVLKPKEVRKCEFYNRGNCKQGNSCKFSHDFRPSTKYTPCTYLARDSCLKGDDCPFDHELSNYPCHKYQQDGMCFRGDKCKFSHAMPTTEATSTPDAKKSDALLAIQKTNIGEHTSSQKTSTVHKGEPVTSAPTKQQYSIRKNLACVSINSQTVSNRIPKGVHFLPLGKSGSNLSSAQQDALFTETRMNANGSQHQVLGGYQTEGQNIVKQNVHKPAPLLNHKNSSKEATMLPCSDPKGASLPTDSIATPGSIHTQHEVSEASRILQEFLFGASS
ncbi:hypothetical protein ACP70R_037695 [Stipagrostis hirtigluma subsp. patula]